MIYHLMQKAMYIVLDVQGVRGRAGRAILFAEPRERRLLGNIERLTKKVIEVSIPNHENVTSLPPSKICRK